MAARAITPPYTVFTDTDGTPLEAGYVYIGTAGLNPEVNPINVYLDAALTIPVAQPIRTLAGYPSANGTPARLYVDFVDYSITVRDKNSALVVTAQNAVVALTAGNIINIPAGDIASTDQQAVNNELDTKKAALAGAIFTGPVDTARGTVAMHATTMDLWAQPNIIDGTGAPVTITAIVDAPQAGAVRILYPITATIITHGATFSVQGGATYTTAAGDGLVFEAVTTSTYKVWILRAANVFGETLANVTASRAFGSTYTNDTNRFRKVNIVGYTTTGNTVVNLNLGGAGALVIARTNVANEYMSIEAIIPPFTTYNIDFGGGTKTLDSWTEQQ